MSDELQAAAQAIALEFGIAPCTAHTWLTKEDGVLARAQRILRALRVGGHTKVLLRYSYGIVRELEQPTAGESAGTDEDSRHAVLVNAAKADAAAKRAFDHFLMEDTPATRAAYMRAVREQSVTGMLLVTALETSPPGIWGRYEDHAVYSLKREYAQARGTEHQSH
jgi:hypothetical protein